MGQIVKEPIFINLDKVNNICIECKKNQLRSRRVWNKKDIIKKIAESNNIFFITENYSKNVTYKDFSCARAHFDKECMKDCICSKNELEKPIENYHFWAYCSYPNS